MPSASATASMSAASRSSEYAADVVGRVALAVAPVVEGDDAVMRAASASTWSAKSSFAPPKPCTRSNAGPAPASRDLQADPVIVTRMRTSLSASAAPPERTRPR